MCHTIGGGSAMGPDLKDVTRRRTHEWLVHFILNPEDAAKTDAAAAALVKQFGGAVMPTLDGATPAVVEAVLQFIDLKSTQMAGATAATRAATAADLADGGDMYAGRRRLAQGGPACVSCHSLARTRGLGGGRLGPDLTAAGKRLGQVPGLTNWLSNPPTPVMRTLFRARPLTPDETFALAAAIDDAGAYGASSARPRRAEFAAYAIALACALLAAMAHVWRDRIRAVRRPLVDAASSRTGDGR